ncbi:MAG: phospholipid carrier-dependent glycosyltransferase [Blastocatellia bacterium]|nr:phospholipid carrier-dependent glycosyltransferase [Blastocatellia bacterium]
MTNALAAILLAGGMFWAGNLVRKQLFRLETTLLTLCFDWGLGASLVGTGVWGLGHAGLYHRYTGYGCLVLGAAAVGSPPVRKALRVLWLGLEAPTWWDKLLRAMTGIGLGSAFLAGLAPPVAKDALVYHLEVPKLYLTHGGIVELPFNVYSYLPQGVESLYTLGLMAWSDRVPALLHGIFGLWLVVAVFSLGRKLEVSPTGCWLAVTMLVVTPVFWLELTWPYVDVALAFFGFLGLTGLLEFSVNCERRWLVLAGWMVGAAVATKYSALIFFLLAGFLYLLIIRQNGTKTPLDLCKDLVCLSGVAGLVVLPWLCQNLVRTGNPLFPFYLNIFPTHSPGWDADRGHQYQNFFLKSYGSQTKDWWDFLTLPFRVCLLGRYEDIHRYDGVTGPFYLAALPVIFLWKQWNRQAQLLGIFCLGYALFWAQSSQQARFLIVIFPPLTLLIVHGFEQLARRGWFFFQGPVVRLALGLAAVVSLGWNGWEIVQHCRFSHIGSVVTGGQSEAAYIREKFAEIPLYDYLHAKSRPTDGVWLVHAGNRTYYLNRPYVADYVFEDFRLINLTKTKVTPQEIRQAIQATGARFLIVRLPLLFAPEFSPFENSADAERLRQFFRAECQVRAQSGDLTLFEIR